MALFQLVIVTPERMLFEDSVKEVRAPGELGEFGILSGHAPFLTTLKAGGVVIIDSEGQTQRAAIGGGVAEVGADRVMILAETAEFSHEIDIERAKKAKSEAENEMKKGYAYDSPEFLKVMADIERATARIMVSSKKES